MSQRTSVNDLESQQCSLLDHQIVDTTDIFLGSPNEKKSRKVVFSVAAVAFAALVIVCSALYWCGSAHDEAHHVVSFDNVSTGNVAPVDENAAIVATVDGEDAAETGLTAWQWGLIGGGAYVASNILCAAFSWSIFSCRVDSSADYHFRAQHGLLSVAEEEARMDPEDYEEMTEEEKEEFRKQSAERLAENEKMFAESKIESPGCCVSCKPRWEVDAIMVGKSAEEKEKFQAELEKAGHDGEVSPKFFGDHITEKVKVAELQETICAENYCGSCVKTALWNFLTLNLCSIVPCAMPSGPVAGCECCATGNACGCAPSCMECKWHEETNCQCGDIEQNSGDDGQTGHDDFQFHDDDHTAS